MILRCFFDDENHSNISKPDNPDKPDKDSSLHNDQRQKAKSLKVLLFNLRFPNVSQSIRKRKQKINALKLGKNIHFIPPENLEKQDFQINFKAKTYNEFKKNVLRLTFILEDDEQKNKLKEIFKNEA